MREAHLAAGRDPVSDARKMFRLDAFGSGIYIHAPTGRLSFPMVGSDLLHLQDIPLFTASICCLRDARLFPQDARHTHFIPRMVGDVRRGQGFCRPQPDHTQRKSNRKKGQPGPSRILPRPNSRRGSRNHQRGKSPDNGRRCRHAVRCRYPCRQCQQHPKQERFLHLSHAHWAPPLPTP